MEPQSRRPSPEVLTTTAQSLGNETLMDRTRSYPASVHFAFVSGVFLPLVFLPYILSRKHIATVRTRLHEAEARTRSLQRELKAAWIELDMRKVEHSQITGKLSNLKKELDEMKARGGRFESEVLDGQRAVTDRLSALQAGMDQSRSVQRASTQAIGHCLGNVAGFMHEVELNLGMERRGNDQRGIEQIRSVAVDLQRQAERDEQKP